MISSLLLEAALRSVLLALAVWIGLRVFSVRNVLAQKAAWGLVLASALVMPLVLPITARVPSVLVVPAKAIQMLSGLLPSKQATPSTATVPAAQQAIITPVLSPVSGDKPVATAPQPRPKQRAGAFQSATADAVLIPAADRYPAPAITQSEPAEAAVHASPAPQLQKPSLLQIAGLLYLAVTVLLLVRLIYGLVVAVDVWQSAKPVLLDSSPLTDGLRLRSSDSISSPVTIGSAVVLPIDYRAWDSEKLRIVLAHERSHIRQGDFYLQLLAGIYSAVVWFSPLGWWLKRTLSDLAEAISDRAGLEQAVDRTSYAQILLEFAAAPRPTPIGVAMARSGSLSRRIERLLNEVSFHQAFAGSRRALLAISVFPVALFVATACVRVEAAGQAPAAPAAPQAPASAPNAAPTPASPAEGISTPEPVQAGPASPMHIAVPEPNPSPALTELPPLPPAHVIVAPPVPAHGFTIITPKPLAVPVHAPVMIVSPRISVDPAQTITLIGPQLGNKIGRTIVMAQNASPDGPRHSGYQYWTTTNGDTYALVRGSGTQHMMFSGRWPEVRRDDIEKARKQVHGDFLWFIRDGKSYVIDDPTTIAQIEAMYKPMEDLGRQQEALGKQQEELGRQQEALGRQQEAATVPTPDMSREMAQIDAAMAKLKAAQGKMMNMDQFAELQSKLGELQGRLGELQGEIGNKQGEFGAKMGELGSKMGELGAQQGRLGEQQGRIAMEADRKIKSIIDEGLKNGKARPVQ